MTAAEKRAREADLAGRYTAHELAILATDLEDQLVGLRMKVYPRTEALRSIARREWTEDGAVKVAQEVLEGEAAVEPEAIHLWFSLSYANYLVVPRSVLQSMPDEWQFRFVGCLREMHDSFGHLDWPSYDVRALARAPQVTTVMVKCPDCDGTGLDAEGQEECEWCDGLGEREDGDSPRYETPEEVGICTDPIPHYNRGRTRLEPKP